MSDVEFELYNMTAEEFLTDEEEMENPWVEVVKGRKLKNAIVADFGMGDVVLAMMEFEDGSFEVGQGEALRPYTPMYSGGSRSQATATFFRYLQRCSPDEEITSFEE